MTRGTGPPRAQPGVPQQVAELQQQLAARDAEHAALKSAFEAELKLVRARLSGCSTSQEELQRLTAEREALRHEVWAGGTRCTVCVQAHRRLQCWALTMRF